LITPIATFNSSAVRKKSVSDFSKMKWSSESVIDELRVSGDCNSHSDKN